MGSRKCLRGFPKGLGVLGGASREGGLGEGGAGGTQASLPHFSQELLHSPCFYIGILHTVLFSNDSISETKN